MAYALPTLENGGLDCLAAILRYLVTAGSVHDPGDDMEESSQLDLDGLDRLKWCLDVLLCHRLPSSATKTIDEDPLVSLTMLLDRQTYVIIRMILSI